MKAWVRLAIAVAILAAILITLKWPRKPAAAAVTSSPPLVSFNSTDATRVEVAQPGQPSVVASGSGSTWKMEQPYAYPADGSVVSGILSTLADITGAQDAGSSNAATFGLDNPTVVEVTMKNGSALDFQFGADSPVGGNTYMRVGANGPIKIVPSYVKQSAVKNAFMVQDKTLLHYPSDKVTGLELVDGGKKVELAKKDGNWPKDQDTNTTSLLDAVQNGQMTAMADPTGKDAAKDGLSSPKAYLEVAWDGGKARLEIGAKKGAAEYYARSSDGPGVFTVSDYIVTDMDTLANPPKTTGAAPALPPGGGE